MAQERWLFCISKNLQDLPRDILDNWKAGPCLGFCVEKTGMMTAVSELVPVHTYKMDPNGLKTLFWDLGDFGSITMLYSADAMLHRKSTGHALMTFKQCNQRASCWPPVAAHFVLGSLHHGSGSPCKHVVLGLSHWDLSVAHITLDVWHW